MRTSPIRYHHNGLIPTVNYPSYTFSEMETVTRDRYKIYQISSLSKATLYHVAKARQEGKTRILTPVKIKDDVIFQAIQRLIMRKHSIVITRNFDKQLLCSWMSTPRH